MSTQTTAALRAPGMFEAAATPWVPWTPAASTTSEPPTQIQAAAKLAVTAQPASIVPVVYVSPDGVPPHPVTPPMMWPLAGVTVKVVVNTPEGRLMVAV